MVYRHILREQPCSQCRRRINSHRFAFQRCLSLIFTLAQDAFQEDLIAGRGRGLSTLSNLSPQRPVYNHITGQAVSGRVLGKDVEENTETPPFFLFFNKVWKKPKPRIIL